MLQWPSLSTECTTQPRTACREQQVLMMHAQRLGQHLKAGDVSCEAPPSLRILLRHSCLRELRHRTLSQRKQFRTETSSSSIGGCRHQQTSPLACKALAAPVNAPAQALIDIPFGDTAGANLIMENVTVQAGHRDLLEVPACASCYVHSLLARVHVCIYLIKMKCMQACSSPEHGSHAELAHGRSDVCCCMRITPASTCID